MNGWFYGAVHMSMVVYDGIVCVCTMVGLSQGATHIKPTATQTDVKRG